MPNNPYTTEKTKSKIPNYSGRAIQIRLVMLVFGVMLVLVLMNKVRQPKTWDWLTNPGNSVPQNDTNIDTRIHALVPEASKTAIQIQADDQFDPQQREKVTLQTDNEDIGNHDFDTAEVDFWKKTYSKLSMNDKTVLMHVVRSALFNREPDSQFAPFWPSVIDTIEQQRTKYYAVAIQSIKALPDDRSSEKQRWLNTVKMMQKFWDQQLSDALSKFVLSRQNTDSEKPAELYLLTENEIGLAQSLNQILEELALRNVEDNALVSKKADMQSWFALFSNLQRLDTSEIEKLSQAKVSYAQLFHQPTSYRGKIVTIAGEIRGAYTVKTTTRNPEGIEQYYVLWVRPDDKSNNPIVVYSLEKPAGFPEINPQSKSTGQEEWKEPCVVHGYFFDKWVYDSLDGTRVCPRMLAKTFEWKPIPVKETKELPGRLSIVIGIFLMGIFAIAVAYLGHRFSKRNVLGDSKTFSPESVNLDPNKLPDSKPEPDFRNID